MGLKGTGSDTFTITDMFIDDAHSLTRESDDERGETGNLYRFQAMQLYATGFSCVGLGAARGRFDAVLGLMKSKTQAWSTDALRDNNAVQSILGYHDAALKAARAGLLKVPDEVWADVSQAGRITVENRVAIRQATTYAIHTARDVAYNMFHEAGSTAIFENQPSERRLRDVSSVVQHLQGRRTHFEAVGLHMLGGQPDLRWL